MLSTAGDKPKPVYYAAGLNKDTGSRILKAAVYDSKAVVPMAVTFAGVKAGTTAILTVITAPSADSNNDIKRSVVKSDTRTLTAGDNGLFGYSLPDLSVSVLEVKA